MDYMTIGAVIGTGFAVSVTFALSLRGYKPKICVVPLLIIALILCLLLGLSAIMVLPTKASFQMDQNTHLNMMRKQKH